MKRRLFYTDQHTIPLPPGHKFPMAKYAMLRELLSVDNRFELVPACLADAQTIERVHDPEYVRAFLAGTLGQAVMRRIGFPWSEGLVKRTLASVGATLAATSEALDRRWGGTLAGGTHHAFAAEGSGFCVFNDIAIAIEHLRSQHKIGRAAVVDVDVHQGDGTAHIFQDDADVLTFSIHCRNNFPLRKQKSKIDVELGAGTGDDEYLEALQPALEKVMDFQPEIVFYQSGVDALASDALGQLSMTQVGLERRDRMVMKAVHRANVPFVITLGGGYSVPISLTAEAHANTFRIATEVWDGNGRLRTEG
jgi:acetoin utilization deacetylase AcuC-like enzyme